MATKLRRIGLTIAIIAAIVLSASASAEAVVPELFGVLDSANLQAMSAPTSISRMAAISANIEVVTLNEAALNTDRINITLGGTQYAAIRTMVEVRNNRESSGYVSRWTIEGAAGPSTITMRNGLVAGTFFSGDGRQYFLMPGYGQTQELLEIDPVAAELLEERHEGSDVVVSSRSSSPENLAVAPLSENLDGYEVKMDMFYNQEAIATLGSAAAVEVAIANKIDCINTGLANSGYTEGHVRLVHVQFLDVDQVDIPMINILMDFALNSAVGAQRDFDRADLVGLWIGGGGGIAYLGGGKAVGFHLVGILSALGNFTQQHEWGHNMWAQHDLENATVPPENSAHPYAYGYYNSQHADVMSYVGTRGEFFSSATGTFQGSPMGTPEQDNIRAIQEAFSLVSQYYPETGCIPSSTALCLLNSTGVTQGSSRFKITIEWTNFAGTAGQGQAVALTSDGGYFWFFNQDNPEVMVKMVNGAGFNGHFWLFISGTTNVEVTVNVTDTITGSHRSWHNPLNRMFVSVGDIEAFPQ